MVAEQLAVVGGEDDVGVVELAASFECVEDLADLVVNKFDGSAVLATGLGDLVGRKVGGALLDPLGFAGEGAADGRGHGRVAIAVAIYSGRVKGIVRADEADEVVPRKIVGHIGNPLGSATANISVLKILAGQRRVAAVGNPARRGALPIVLVKRRQLPFGG